MAQNTAFGLRGGVSLWHGDYSSGVFATDRKNTGPNAEAELFARTGRNRRAFETSFGIRHYKDNFRDPGFGMQEVEEEISVRAVTIGFGAEYRLHKQVSATSVYAGLGVMMQIVKANGIGHQLEMGTRLYEQSFRSDERMLMAGPHITTTHKLSGHFSLLAKAGYLVDVFSGSRNNGSRGCGTLSAGAFYTF
jgi:hypothetical protein